MSEALEAANSKLASAASAQAAAVAGLQAQLRASEDTIKVATTSSVLSLAFFSRLSRVAFFSRFFSPHGAQLS